MSQPTGSLSSLLKYRFVKKPIAKLSHSDAQNQTLAHEDSTASVDSQATIPYNSQDLTDSQSTQPYSHYQQSQGQNSNHDSQDTLPPSQVDPSNDCTGSASNPGQASSVPGSPIFASKTSSSANRVVIMNPSSGTDSSNTPITSPPPGPWISKETGNVNHTVTNGDIAKFKRVMRPETDSDEDSPKKAPLSNFERLKQMFPNGSENRMRAALIVHPNNFQEAVKFVQNDYAPSTSGEAETILVSVAMFKKCFLQ
ncbi:hypothetical protein PoB_003505900 [Plakobranchus ocellatus]|uniref:Uncharacterized protein n=1 Tax=Plakobranchus ocellatus TaxID=259542 RepID=A0AAV4ALD2_9GAST|nr:hypothetical protein PoB_003505900 [Plakobranchus ocellatus]